MPAPKKYNSRKVATPSPSVSRVLTLEGGAKSQDAIEDRKSRKRVQNRIAQQCAREKQAAYSKQFGTLAGIIKLSTTTERESTESLNVQLALIEENNKLRDALLRMRKKMLSLSSALGGVAGKKRPL